MTTTVIDLLVCFVGFEVQAGENGLDVIRAAGGCRFALRMLKLSQEVFRIQDRSIMWYLPCCLQ
jgi:hypothetical protein